MSQFLAKIAPFNTTVASAVVRSMMCNLEPSKVAIDCTNPFFFFFFLKKNMYRDLTKDLHGHVIDD
jgi:hypothetical protein